LEPFRHFEVTRGQFGASEPVPVLTIWRAPFDRTPFERKVCRITISRTSFDRKIIFPKKFIYYYLNEKLLFSPKGRFTEKKWKKVFSCMAPGDDEESWANKLNFTMKWLFLETNFRSDDLSVK
jgi:hypothetical protein